MSYFVVFGFMVELERFNRELFEEVFERLGEKYEVIVHGGTVKDCVDSLTGENPGFNASVDLADLDYSFSADPNLTGEESTVLMCPQGYGMFSFSITEHIFWNDDDSTSNTVNAGKVARLAADLIAVLKPYHAFGCHEFVIEAYNYGDEDWGVEESTPYTEGIFWANYFSPQFMDKIGPEKFASIPAYHKEEINGGVFLLTEENPIAPSEGKRVNHKELTEYLGLSKNNQ